MARKVRLNLLSEVESRLGECNLGGGDPKTTNTQKRNPNWPNLNLQRSPRPLAGKVSSREGDD